MLRRASTAVSASSKGRSSLRTSNRGGSGSSTRTPRRSRSTRSTAGSTSSGSTCGRRSAGARRSSSRGSTTRSRGSWTPPSSRCLERDSRPVLPDQGARGPRALPSEAPRDAVGVGARLEARRAGRRPGPSSSASRSCVSRFLCRSAVQPSSETAVHAPGRRAPADGRESRGARRRARGFFARHAIG